MNGTPGASNVVKTPTAQQNAVQARRSGGIIGVHADHLATIVDVGGLDSGRPRDVDGGEPSLVPEEAVEPAAGVEIAAHQLATVS